jgi:hypothetical protein
MREIRLTAKRTRRNLKRLKAHGRWRDRYWWQQFPLEQAALERGLDEAYPGFERGRIGRALVYRGTVQLDTLETERTLVLIFPERPSRTRPIVMADGPTRSRHRFYWSRPSSLCLWFARDHEGLRWTVKDGLVALIDLARLHLIKEAWWRATGEWPGWEKHREPPAGDERRPRPPRPAARRKSESPKWIRYDRRRCWCGAARYVKCHGAIPPEDELDSLGLA